MFISSKTKGIICIILSAFCFGLLNIFIRLAGDIPSVEKSLFRNLIAMIVAAAAIQKPGAGFHYEKKDMKLLLLRSICGTVGILCNFNAVDHMLFADSTAIQKLVPFIMIVASFILLKGKIKSWQIGLILIAFSGILLVVKPGFSAYIGPAIIQFIGAVEAGTAYTYVRMITLAGQT